MFKKGKPQKWKLGFRISEIQAYYPRPHIGYEILPSYIGIMRSSHFAINKVTAVIATLSDINMAFG